MCDTVAAQLVGHEPHGFLSLTLQQSAKESPRCSPVPTGLYEDVDQVTVLIHRAPEILALTVDRHEDFVQAPTLFGSPRHETARLRAPGECGPPRRHPGRRRPDRGDDTAPGTGSPDASHTRWSGRSATRGRPAARHTPDGWRSTGRHSSRRPPPGQRAVGLQLVHLRIQQLGLHQQLAELGLQPTMVFVPGIRRAAL